MRAARLVTLMLLLQARERLSARELAAALEVSVRTVHRDIEALSSAGVPVYAERGSKGGFRLLEGHRLQMNGLTDDEAAALPFAGLPAIAAALGLETAGRSTELKLAAALPADTRAVVERSSAQVHIDTDPWDQPTDTTTVLRALRSSIERGRVIRLRTHDGWSATVQPLGLVWKVGSWHLVAMESGEPHSVAVATIAQVVATGERFALAKRFDLAAWWRSWLATLSDRGPTAPRERR